jgi:hypothetical protein
MHHLHTVFIVSSSLTVTTIINNAMIKSTYTDDWRLINQLSIAWPFAQEEVYTALENETYFGDEGRTYCHEIKSNILKSIYDTVVSNLPKLQEELFNQSEFQSHWGAEYACRMINNIKTTCHFICDKPGFTTGIHIDEKSSVCAGMIFFNKFDNADHSTTFCTSVNGDNPVQISSKYGNGWLSANTYNSYHIGGNNSSVNRYAIIIISKLDLR